MRIQNLQRKYVPRAPSDTSASPLIACMCYDYMETLSRLNTADIQTTASSRAPSV